MTDVQGDDGVALKLHAARRLTVRAWDALKKTNGSVVFMSGSAAFNPKPAFAAVAVINAAINAYLFSPAAKWMTGAAVRMDGGEIKGV